MKQTLFTLILLFTTVISYSQKKSFARWSLTLEGGIDRFDGDVSQDIKTVIPTAFGQVTYGGALYYNFTPVWGICLDYYHLPLRAQDATISFNTQVNSLDLNATINFTKLIFPQSHSKVSFCGSLGLGFAKYDAYYRSPDPVNSPELLFRGDAISCPVTFFVEWNFIKSMALGARVHYRSYNKDNFEGDYSRYNFKGVTNDYIAALTAFVRVKFFKKNQEHLRNVSLGDYLPDPAMELAKANTERLNKMDGDIARIEEKVDNQGAKLDSISKLLSNDGPDSDGDGVPDFRDKHPNTPANVPVDFWGAPLKVLATTNRSQSRAMIDDGPPSLYFDFDKIELDNDALITIRRISLMLKADQTLMVEARAYCDNTGTSPYNNLLSQRRADRVKAELVNAWGISPDRIIANGKGRVTDQKGMYRPNRRCDFYFNK